MGCKQSKDNKTEEEVKAEEGAADQAAEGGSDDQPRVVVVFGATELEQSESVLRALHKDASFKVRVVAADPDAEKAKSLAELENVEVVKADLDDVESLKAAFEGAAAAFVATDFAALNDQEKDTQLGKNAADAAKEAGVKHFLYSGQPSATETGKACRFMDAKAAVEAYIKETDLPYTIVHLPPYYEDMLSHWKPVKREDGSFVIDLPASENPLPMICIEEFGECVRQVLLKEDEFKGKTLALASQQLKVDEYAALLTKGLNDKKVEAGGITIEELAKKSDEPMAAEWAVIYEHMTSGKIEFDIDITRQLHPEMSSFENWVEKKKDALEKIME